MSTQQLRELSVIIPTLNEADALPLLLADLAGQAGVDFEVLVSDGGSADATRELAAAALTRYGLDGEVLVGEAGRGRQLNRGAGRAHGEWLLFVHADSRLPVRSALADGLAVLRSTANPRSAGRFTLRFDLPEQMHDIGYDLCELKARLGFPGTIHGDQGFWLARSFFRELGGFREDLPVLEDTLLAEAIRQCGEWLLLPATIITSPRRFRVEGFAERQTLNALLMNFAMIGWDEPLHRAPAVYRPHGRAGRLEPAGFFRMIDACLRELSIGGRLRIWYRTGEFVRGNAWQLVLRRKVRLARAAGKSPEAVTVADIERVRRRFDLLTGHPPGRLAAALLTWLWFRTRRRTSSQGA